MLSKLRYFMCCCLFFINTVTAYEFGIITMFRNEAPYLLEWIEYHQMIGVDHFWMYNDTSTDNWQEVLQKYIDAGIVEVINWPAGTCPFLRHQVLAFKDGIARTVGKVKWVALIDIDEFILPLKESTVTECLNKYFEDAAAVYVNWRNFGTSGITIPSGEPILFKLTSCSLRSHSNNAVGKSIVRPEYVCVQDIWYPHHFPLEPGYYYLNGNRKKMQFSEDDLHTEGKHHDKFICINHYALRDESYFQTRLERAKSGEYGNVKSLMEYHESYSLVKEFRILEFIKTKHKSKYDEIWKNFDSQGKNHE